MDTLAVTGGRVLTPSPSVREADGRGDTGGGGTPPGPTCAAQTGAGTDGGWAAGERPRPYPQDRGALEEHGREQARHWMYETIKRRLRDDFFSDPDVEAARDEIETAVQNGTLSSVAAAEQLLSAYQHTTPNSPDG